jgi:hypothetical protein
MELAKQAQLPKDVVASELMATAILQWKNNWVLEDPLDNVGTT